MMNPELINKAYDPLFHMKDNIDKLVGNEHYFSIHETSYTPFEAINYLTRIWGFNNPVLDYVDTVNKELQFIIRSPINMTLMLHVRWESGFRRGFILRRL